MNRVVYSILTDDEDPLDNEYYSFLNVSRTATQEEITAAYKKLSRLELMVFLHIVLMSWLGAASENNRNSLRVVLLLGRKLFFSRDYFPIIDFVRSYVGHSS